MDGCVTPSRATGSIMYPPWPSFCKYPVWWYCIAQPFSSQFHKRSAISGAFLISSLTRRFSTLSKKVLNCLVVCSFSSCVKDVEPYVLKPGATFAKNHSTNHILAFIWMDAVLRLSGESPSSHLQLSLVLDPILLLVKPFNNSLKILHDGSS